MKLEEMARKDFPRLISYFGPKTIRNAVLQDDDVPDYVKYMDVQMYDRMMLNMILLALAMLVIGFFIGMLYEHRVAISAVP